MKTSDKTFVLVVCSALVAIAAMFLFSWLKSDGESTTKEYMLLWEKVFVVAIALFSFVFGFLEPRSPWRWPLLMAYVHYFSGFFIMEHWGQIPPFELVYITVLSLPGIATGYLGSFLRKKIVTAQV